MNNVFKIAAVCAMGLASSVQAESISFFTEDYAPLNFEQDGEIVGVATDQVKQMMQRAGLDYSLELTQWSRAINLAEKKPNTCVFATTHTEERDARFQWVEPLSADKTVLVKLKGSDVNVNSIEDARALRTGTQTGDYTVGVLKDNGFELTDLSPNFEVTVKKLKAGRIDLLVTSGSFYESAVAEGQPMEAVLTLSETIMSVACSKGTDADLIARMQAALDAMIAAGVQAEIAGKYR